MEWTIGRKLTIKVSAGRGGRTVGAVVPGRGSRGRRAPHQDGLSHGLVPVNVGLDVLDFGGEYPVVVGARRRTAGRVRRRRGRLEGVTAARPGDHHRGHLVLLLQTRYGTAVATRDRGARVWVVVLGGVGLQLLVALVRRGQGHVDEAVVARRRRVVLRVVRAQGSVLEYVLRGSQIPEKIMF